jgi:hypothetical protein
MKIKYKPFRIFVDDYHVLNLKRVGLLLLAVIALITAIYMFMNSNNSKSPVKAVIVDHNPMPIRDTLCTNINGIRIFVADSVDGRPTFDVVLEDEKVLEKMYAEEIAYSLLHNKWIYNEDLSLDSLTTIKN